MSAITNNGGSLKDCTFEVSITGKDKTSVTNVYYAEQWGKGQTLWALCGAGSTVKQVDRVTVHVFSPESNANAYYSYSADERTKTHQWLFKNVKFLNPRYQPREPGIFSDYDRSFSTHIGGVKDRLPACKLSVTFVKNNQKLTFSTDMGSWTPGTFPLDYGAITPGNNQLTFEPDTIIAEISFPDSTFVIRETFTVEGRNLRRR